MTVMYNGDVPKSAARSVTGGIAVAVVYLVLALAARIHPATEDAGKPVVRSQAGQ